MKKLLFILSVLFLCTSISFGQSETEKKLDVKPFPIEQLAVQFSKGNVDCKCSNNLLQDGGFQNVSVGGAGLPSNINGSSTPWKAGSNTPQWSGTIQPACDKGVVSMWGNQTVGESIYQNGIPFVAGKTYRVKFTARFVNPTSLSTFVRLKLFLFGSGAPSGYDGSGVASVNITNSSWETYSTNSSGSSLTFMAGPGQNSIALHPENDYRQNDGSYVSWIQLDNICIEEVCKIPDEKCNPGFNVNPFTLNSQCNVIINVNPVVAAGAQHYWGLVGASSLGDNAPIPLSTILSGGSFGLGVSATGVATPIGMGTGITASSSGYGYQYQGVALGQCFKITHYIKCCNKWYSTTKTFCTKVCSEVKEAGMIEVSPKEVEKLEASEAIKGRG